MRLGLALVLALSAGVAGVVGVADSACTDITAQDALLVIDVQNCFMERFPIPEGDAQYSVPEDQKEQVDGRWYVKGGPLAVDGTADIIDPIQDWIDLFEQRGAPVFLSLDWHPAGHCSFCRNGTASTRKVCGPLGPDTPHFNSTGRCEDTISVQDFNRGAYMQWPDHCLQNEFGSRFTPYMRVPSTAIVVKKGFNPILDSYSAFGGRLSNTPAPFWDGNDTVDMLNPQPDLPLLIARRDVRRLFTVGIASDFCVRMSTLDALAQRFGDVVMVQSAARGVTPDGVANAVKLLRSAGAIVPPMTAVTPQDVLDYVCAADTDSDSDGDDGGDDNDTAVLALGVFVGLFAATTIGLAAYLFMITRKSSANDSFQAAGVSRVQASK